MAEGGMTENAKNTLPIRGKVNQVRQQFAVHEDGAFAYQLQNQEIDRHYDHNRYNRRTVRTDIPIAKVVQDEEEVREQNDRFQELQALQVQAEEDASFAKRLIEEEQIKSQANKMAIELTDEEIAKNIQEKEKQKYERYLEKKKLQKLKKEREKIEANQQQRTEEARLHVRQSSGAGSTGDIAEQMTDLNVQNAAGNNPAMRVMPGGAIEDDGDFSDFYKLPEHMDPAHRQVLQELQDEELARLLQEQEHKRTKAEVDKEKLREIEEQDKRLAEIIQEQEKIRQKKAKQKWKQQQESKRAQAAQRPPALPPRNPPDHDHRRYRRNSFILSMENGPEDGEEYDDSQASDEYLSPTQRQDGTSPGVGGRTTLNNSAGNTNSREISQNRQNVQKVRNNIHAPRNQAGYGGEVVPQAEMPDVERWLASQPPDGSRRRLRSDDSEHIPDSPSPPGSYHSEDTFPQQRYSRSHHHNASADTGSHYAVSDPFNFNIATAIDPTYTKRNSDQSSERRKHPSNQNQSQRSVAVEDRTLPPVPIRDESFQGSSDAPFLPVQGQRRNMGERSRKSNKIEKGSQNSGKDKDKCKQQ